MPLGNLAEKYRAFGWDVRSVDGHNMEEILETLDWADTCQKPAMIIAHTILGK